MWLQKNKIYTHEPYMQRCIQLAQAGAGHVSPNPMVGAVLVHDNRIIGEGYHKQYGNAHAEVNCLQSVAAEDKHLVPLATLYVSLEPCSHYGKTPPCADLIVSSGITQVVIGPQDPNEKVSGNGIRKLQSSEVSVFTGVLEDECKEINKRFFTFHKYKRPYIVLKWAETDDGFIASNTEERLIISNHWSNRLVHKWRSEEAAIIVGYNTALNDNPLLSTRLWPGKNPIKIVIDPDLQLPSLLNIFNPAAQVIVFNFIKNESLQNIEFVKIDASENIVSQIVSSLHRLQIQSILIEGGRKTLQAFIDANCWDEIRVIKNRSLSVFSGISRPDFHAAKKTREVVFENDTISFYTNPHFVI